jgi:hypothetical protein
MNHNTENYGQINELEDYISPIVNMRPKNEVLALMQDGSRKGSLYLKGCVKQENAFFL